MAEAYLREWRDHAGLSIEEMSERTGLAIDSVSRLERGVLRWDKNTLAAYAEALSVQPDDLLFKPPLR